MLAFPLSSSPTLPWSQQQISSQLITIFSFVDFVKLSYYFPTMHVVSFMGAVSWMVGLLACVAWVGRGFINESFTALWPIKVQR